MSVGKISFAMTTDRFQGFEQDIPIFFGVSITDISFFWFLLVGFE